MRWKMNSFLKKSCLIIYATDLQYNAVQIHLCVLLFWLLSHIYRLINVVIEAGGFTTYHNSPMQKWRRERWMEYKTPRAEVELGTCISPPSTPTCCPLSCLPLCFLSRSFLYNLSTTQLLWLLFPVGIHMHARTTRVRAHKNTHSSSRAVQRQSRQLSFDLERKVASTTNNDRHSRNKRSAVITQQNTHANPHGRMQAKCITHKNMPKAQKTTVKSRFNHRYSQAATHT